MLRARAAARPGERDDIARLRQCAGHHLMSTDAQPSDPQPPDDDLSPHLASPEAFARWCREHPGELRQLEMTARRIELGEFGDVTPEVQANIKRFLAARKILREAEAQNATMLAGIRKTREMLTSNPATIPAAHLVTQLADMEQRLLRGESIREEWEQFQLQLTAFHGELMGSIWKRYAMIAMSADAHDRKDPQKFAKDANAQALVKAWRSGMRERIFGELPIAERR